MNNIRALREKRDITQIRLSTAVEVTQETISAYESGRSRPSVETLVRIADFLNTSTDYLLGRISMDVPLSQIIHEKVDDDVNKLLGNYAMLNDQQKRDLLWFSNALKDKK